MIQPRNLARKANSNWVFYDETGTAILTLDKTTGAATFAGDVAFTGELQAPDGTVALPGLTFSADVDSGLYRIGANNVGVAVAGAKVLDVSATGLGVTGTLTADGAAYIGDTANANVTLGLTINQGAADNIALALKSSDVATVLTTIVTGTVETDDYATFSKFAAATGGLMVQALGENAAVTTNLLLESYGGQADTTKTTAARGLAEIYVSQHDGANALADIGANGNAFAVRGRRGSGDVALFVVDEDGDLFATQANVVTAFDEHDDIQLVRAFDEGKRGLVRNQWDAHVKANERALLEIGVLGAPRSEGGLVNMTRLIQLHNGAFWQLYSDLMDVVQALPGHVQRSLPERIQSRLALT